MSETTYTITKLDTWTDEQWAEVVEAVEDLVADMGEEIESDFVDTDEEIYYDETEETN